MKLKIDKHVRKNHYYNCYEQLIYIYEVLDVTQ